MRFSLRNLKQNNWIGDNSYNSGLSSFFFKSTMVYYYIGVDSCIYTYNSDTDHWIVKSPKIIYKNNEYLLGSLNCGVNPRELELKKIGKTRAYNFLNNQYKDIEDTWEYQGNFFKTGKIISSDEKDYNIIYYHGKIYPVLAYRKSTNTFILKEGKLGRFEVNVLNCAEIWKRNPDGKTYSEYGKTII